MVSQLKYYIKHIFLVINFLFIYNTQSYCQTPLSGSISSDMTLTEIASPYVVTGELTVLPGVTLTIEPGAELQFEFNALLISKGVIFAKGTFNKPITFSSTAISTSPSLWKGILVLNGKTIHQNEIYENGFFFNNVIIKNANRAFRLAENTSIIIDSVNFKNCNYGIVLEEATNNIFRNSNFDSCNYGIFHALGYYSPLNTVKNCTFSNCNNAFYLNSFPEHSFGNIIQDNYFYKCTNACNIGGIGLWGGNGNQKITRNRFEKCEACIKNFHSSSNISENTFTRNSYGIYLRFSDSSQITNNVIVNSQYYGIVLMEKQLDITIKNNSFYYNNYAVYLDTDRGKFASENKFINNTFYRNKPSGSFFFFGISDNIIQYNNIVENDFNSFVNFQQSDYIATHNFWGTNSSSEIDSIIFDKNDYFELGLVQYMPFAENEVIEAPILPPLSITKQLREDKVYVSHSASGASDVKGYNIYYNKIDDFNFSNKINSKPDTAFVISSANIFDTIAATCYDINTTSINLPMNSGFESYFGFADIIPYSGRDTVICVNDTFYKILNTTAPGFDSIMWSTNGDGSFDDKTILNPSYFPGANDHENQEVVLTLNGYKDGKTFSDSFILIFTTQFITNYYDTITYPKDETIDFEGYVNESFDNIKWITNGDGFFSDNSIVNPIYHPGNQEINDGFAKLTCFVTSICDSTVYNITIRLLETYSLNGFSHSLGENFGIKISAYSLENDNWEKFKSIYTQSNSEFSIDKLFAGKYIIHGVPTEQSNFVPTYFFKKLSWDNAEVVDLQNNTYDIDLVFNKIYNNFGTGSGIIRGNVVGELCDSSYIFLTDTALNVVFAYKASLDNTFMFEDLPFGNYFIHVETPKIGSVKSGVITITPQKPVIENVKIFCEGKKTRIYYQENKTDNDDELTSTKIYPNPCNDILYVENSKNIKSFITITDISGRTLITNRIWENSKTSINLQNLSKGIYIINLYTENQQIERHLFIKE